MPIGLGLILFNARNRLRDMSVRLWTEPSLIASANEGKNQLCRLLRHTREDYFVISTPISIPTVANGAPSEVTLPNDFAEFKDIESTQAGFFNLTFSPLDRTDPLFRDRVVNQGSYPITDGMSIYYDIIGRNTIQFSPGFNTTLTCKLWYVQVVKDMILPTDVPNEIPWEYWDWIVNFVVCDALRGANDPRYGAFIAQLNEQGQLIINAAQQRRVAADPKFARAFDEDA